MAGAVLKRSPEYFDKFNVHCLLICTFEDYQQYLVTDTFAVATHVGKCCQLIECKHHILLYSQSPLWKNLAGLNFRYKRVDNLYYIFKYYIQWEDRLLTKGWLINDIDIAIKYNKKHVYMENRPSVVKKRISRKKYRQHIASETIHHQKNSSSQTVVDGLQDRIETVLKGSFALEFIQIIDCLVQSHGCIDSKQLLFICK